MKFKAWFVWVGTPGMDWGDYVHGETASKAKAQFWKQWSWEAEEWIRLRPIRVPMFDGIPLTRKTLSEYYSTPGNECYIFDPCCDCELCKQKT
jgi:hypothetical protein